ncbi:phage major capsid protein, P2 family [Maricurvus nonylphenolicus]|uniref:phage major capsid protein, P2 family n=1 Tax=Maricurvus nonylphenolicus TaxID=1008307 RepID=UPI0036F41C3A
MHKDTRKQIHGFNTQIAKLNDVDIAVVADGKKFSVTPDVETKLEERIKESSGFLQKINITSVINQSGRKVGIGANSTIAGRSNTAGGTERTTQDPTGEDEFTYMCRQTNFDTHLSYAKLDSWRHRKDFQKLVQAAVTKQIGRDRIMIGFNGTSAAVNTNRVANPLLQDVNIGWLEKIRTEAPAHHTDGITIGGTGSPDFNNLDAAVMSATNELIAEWVQEDTELVVILGRTLFNDKFEALVNDHGEPTEKLATDVLIGNKKVGGLKAMRVPFFPPNAFLVTPLDNLSIYWQEGSRRRSIEENSKLDRVEDYQSVNEDYVVEDYESVAFVENITESA